MAASRLFSVLTRRANLIDIMTPFYPGATGYRVQVAPNFDATFQTAFTAAPIQGWIDKTIDRRLLTSIPNRDLVRMVWDPANYSALSILDGAQIWVKVAAMNGGSTIVETPPSLILPVYDRVGKPQIIIAGLAPTAATSALALQLDLPMGFRNIQIFNKGANVLSISTFPGGGPEVDLAAASSGDFTLFGGSQDCLRVRGNTAFSASLVVPFIE
jgi:hypothetical protein